MPEPRTHARKGGCWRGKDDPTPFVPGIPAEVPRAATLHALFQAMACCTRCDLARERTQVVNGVGPASAEIMFVGEAPGADEDRQGAPFVGRSGRLLDRLLVANGLERRRVFITNVVACRPPGNRNPRAREIQAHAPWLEEQIRLVAPRLIVTLGRIALTYFIPKARVTRIRGTPQTIERNGRSITLLPLLHPSAVLRRRELLPAMEADFVKIPALLRRA
ncbi:MAG TPA: uracil-DNA glycosylase [Longimicrobiales bacterium]